MVVPTAGASVTLVPTTVTITELEEEKYNSQ